MISSITFETAALADIIKKADKIAPTRGSAFDKAAGIIIQFDPQSPVPLAVVRATNLDIFMMEWVTVAEWAGEAALWRLPSTLLAMVVGSLPIGTGKTVTLESEATGHSMVIHLKSGRTKAKFYQLDPSYYPEWGAFDPDEMFPASDMGGRIEQVEWAAAKSDPRLAGVYLDGTYAIATDTYRLACVPLSIPSLPEPVVVPSGILGQTLRQTGDIQIGMSSQDKMLRIMPDEHTQIKTVVYDVKYPNVSRIMDMEFDTEVKFDKNRLLEIMSRVNAFAMGERGVGMRTFFGKEEIAVYMANEEMGTIGDVLEVPGQIPHDRIEILFTPKNIMEALTKAPNNDVTVKYNKGEPKKPFYVDGGSGYRAWVMPRTGMEKEDG
jgi:DNA polymerase III sliding clamp (beta) subunit (PCNA family)